MGLPAAGEAPSGTLLAIDLGLRSGFALFDDSGRLRWYRSQNFGSVARLKRAVPGVLAQADRQLVQIVTEGPRDLAAIWQRFADTRGVVTRAIVAETWRPQLLLHRQQRSGGDAKRWADQLARQVIAWSGAPRPTSLRHDAAEAILIGLWGVLDLGWLERLPPELGA